MQVEIEYPHSATQQCSVEALSLHWGGAGGRVVKPRRPSVLPLLFVLQVIGPLVDAHGKPIAVALTPERIEVTMARHTAPSVLDEYISPLLDGVADLTTSAATTTVDAQAMFIENVGQFEEGARFQVRGGDRTIWLAEDAIWTRVREGFLE